MQGPTYALCYSTIVGYAAHVAPEGYSATVQGIVAGMDDGLGKFKKRSSPRGYGGGTNFRIVGQREVQLIKVYKCKLGRICWYFYLLC